MQVDWPPLGSNFEALIEDELVRSTALALDGYLFDANAGDTIRPAGLRHGIAASTASAATVATDAMFSDLATLVAAVAPVSSKPPILITAPTRANLAPMMAPHAFEPLTVLASNALSSGDVIMVAPDTLVSAIGSVPQIEYADATVDLDDQPSEIAPPGGPIAAPVRSGWQTDTIKVRLKFPASWALRDARGLAWLTTTKW